MIDNFVNMVENMSNFIFLRVKSAFLASNRENRHGRGQVGGDNVCDRSAAIIVT